MIEPRIRLPLEHARTLTAYLFGRGTLTSKLGAAKAELARLVAQADYHREPRAKLPPQKFAKPSPLDREQKRHERRGRKAREDMKVYDAVTKRAGGVCECGCGRLLDKGLLSKDVRDHFWGRAKAPTREDTVWVLRNDCNLQKTENKPGRAYWLGKYLAHCQRHGYREQASRCVRELEAESLIAKAAEVSRHA